MNATLHALLGPGLWILIMGAWVALLVIGLEADKPLSGDLPGQLARGDRPGDLRAGSAAHAWKNSDRLGERASWALFGAACVLLPLLLVWVFAAHG